MNGTELGQGVEQHNMIGAIGQHDAHHIPGANPGVIEDGGKIVHAPGQFAIADQPLAILNSGMVGPLKRMLLENIGDVHARSYQASAASAHISKTRGRFAA